MYESYRCYVGCDGITYREQAINAAKRDLLAYAQGSPDFHTNTLRNGEPQSFILTRGGEQHQYNIICMPDDELYAGDIIDAFGEKWIVMEARADATTHKTGSMHQCNHLFRFQNFSPDIIECWGYIDQSGYSSSVTGTSQIQRSEEQLAIYLPLNEDTQKLFVDKRLCGDICYDTNGNMIANTYRITSVSHNTMSFNQKDHLLMLKTVRDVYSEFSDNLEELICDYIPPDDQPQDPDHDGSLLLCEIVGGNYILLGRSRTYTPVFFKSDGETVDDSISPLWKITGQYADLISTHINGSSLVVQVPIEDAMIGSTIEIELRDPRNQYAPCTKTVEVRNIA